MGKKLADCQGGAEKRPLRKAAATSDYIPELLVAVVGSRA
jgi:hypothetical protein